MREFITESKNGKYNGVRITTTKSLPLDVENLIKKAAKKSK